MNIIQALEQYATFLRDVVPMLRQYMDDLQKQGFTEEQAFRMTVELQKSLTNGGKGE